MQSCHNNNLNCDHLSKGNIYKNNVDLYFNDIKYKNYTTRIILSDLNLLIKKYFTIIVMTCVI